MMHNNKIFFATLVVFIVVALISGLVFQPKFSAYRTYQEEPLEKLTTIKFFHGEQYIYEYLSSNGRLQAGFGVFENGKCQAIIPIGVKNISIPCFSNDGVEVTGGNFSFISTQIPVFQPWMLAVHNNWTWHVNETAMINGAAYYSTTTSFRTINDEVINGRETYKVEISTPTATIYSWIDREKRILIKEESDFYKINLISAPFPLELQEE